MSLEMDLSYFFSFLSPDLFSSDNFFFMSESSSEKFSYESKEIISSFSSPSEISPKESSYSSFSFYCLK